MAVRQVRRIACVGLVLLAAGCGRGARSTTSGVAAGAAGVRVAGHVTERGTRGSVLVYAYSDLAAGEDPSARAPASLSTVAPDGAFDLAVSAAGSLTLVFLADGANDGVVDQGDPIAILSSPELTELQAGDQVRVSDARVDFANHRVAATVEVARTSAPARTPTPLPAS